jgi:membrane protease YdiL (CAAX protease family)
MSPETDSHVAIADASPSAPFYRSWFVNQFGHRRAFWRIALFVLIAFLLGAAISRLANLVPLPDEGDAMVTWKGVVGSGGACIAMIVAAGIVLRWLDHRPTVLLGLSLSAGWKRDLALGIFLGFAFLSSVLVCLWIGGWVSLSVNDLTPALLGGISKAMLMFFLAALAEELLIRGYPLQAFIEGSRPWIAVIVLSSIFSVMHLGNPDMTIPSALNIFFAGVLLSVCYLKTRSLWLPAGLHFGWNWAQGSFWGMGVSGFHVQWSVFAAQAHGADWISGGKFGAEASIIATVIIPAAAYLIWRSDKFGVAEELKVAWAAFPRGYKLPPQPDKE